MSRVRKRYQSRARKEAAWRIGAQTLENRSLTVGALNITVGALNITVGALNITSRL
jgi:hypothetical protein